MRVGLLVVLAVVSLLSQQVSTQRPADGSSPRKYMSESLQLATEKLAAFAGNRDIQLLRDAEETLEAIDVSREHNTPKRLLLRQRTLEVWLQVAAQIDRNLDPSFDPNDVPMESMVPPPSDGVSLSSNAPDNIKDPQVRAQFQRAVDENTRKTIRYTFQWQLRRLNERVTPKLEQFVRFSYVPVGPDQ